MKTKFSYTLDAQAIPGYAIVRVKGVALNDDNSPVVSHTGTVRDETVMSFRRTEHAALATALAAELVAASSTLSVERKALRDAVVMKRTDKTPVTLDEMSVMLAKHDSETRIALDRLATEKTTEAKRQLSAHAAETERLALSSHDEPVIAECEVTVPWKQGDDPKAKAAEVLAINKARLETKLGLAAAASGKLTPDASLPKVSGEL